jgi:hypothetical protein
MIFKLPTSTLSRACVILSVIYLFGAGCKKASSTAYYITFQVGSKSYSIDSFWASHFDAPAHGVAIRGVGTQADANNNRWVACDFEAFNYSSVDTSAIATYGNESAYPNANCLCAITIVNPNDANNGQFYIGPNGTFTLTVTANSAESVSGTFQGTMGGVPISNGRFNVPYKN